MGGDELSAKRMIGEYEFVCRQLYQAVDVKALLCKQAELFVKDKEMLSVLDPVSYTHLLPLLITSLYRIHALFSVTVSKLNTIIGKIITII